MPKAKALLFLLLTSLLGCGVAQTGEGDAPAAPPDPADPPIVTMYKSPT